jgi:hypothetical protein
MKKPKRGAPRKSEEARKSKQITVKLTPADHAEITRLAVESRLTVTDYLTRRGLGID